MLSPASSSAAGGAVINSPGCQANTLPANDDGSTGAVQLPFTLNFFGADYSSLYINNNGNVTFNAPMSTYTPFDLSASTPPIIAPFFADVDTRGVSSGLVTYGTTTFQGHQAFCVEWPYVGYFPGETDKLNDFELLLVDRSDAAPGDFDIVFNYDQIQWETGGASGGSDGLGGTSAGVGFSAGDNNASDYYELNGSLVNGAFLDSNLASGLTHNGIGSTVPGRYIFHVTGSGLTNGGGLNGLSRDWPSGLGYSFPNYAISHYLSESGGLPFSAITTDAAMENTFSDWAQLVSTSPYRPQVISKLYDGEESGVCFGLALSGGRFAAGLASLYDPNAGRSDAVWQEPNTLGLPEPGTAGSDSLYDTQFLTRVEQDFVSQYSAEAMSSMEQQRYAYADPTPGAGLASLEAQLASVMSSGTNLYPYGSGNESLNTGGGSGYALIALQALKTDGTQGYWGHAVLAYSAEIGSAGDLQINVWDNDHPNTSYTIDVQPDGTWTYDAPDGNLFAGTLSMSGQPGYREGDIAVLPLYDPIGLHYDPSYTISGSGSSLGSGSYVDVPAGVGISSATDSAEDPVAIEAISSDDGTDSPNVINFPSGAGTVTLTGPDPSLDVRTQNAYMTGSSADTSGADQQIGFNTDPLTDTIGAVGAAADLTVGHGGYEIDSTGVGQLTYARDGSVSTIGDSGTVILTVLFTSNGAPYTAQLYSGAAPASGALTFSAAQVSAAEQQALTPPSQPPSQPTPQAQPTQPVPATVIARVARASRITVVGHTAKVKLTCTAQAGASCQVVGLITVIEKLKAGKVIAITATASHGKHAGPTQRRTVTISRTAASIPAGQTMMLTWRLNGAGVRLLRKRTLHAHLQITFDRLTVAATTITFKHHG